MSGKSRTFGWDALVGYDRRKINLLLEQLYIERFNSESYLPLINEPIQSSAYSTEHVSALKLSMPKLSFLDASLETSTAELTMDLVGGMIITELEASGALSRIDKIQKVLPIGGPQLSMVVNWATSPVDVTKDGTVKVDISKAGEYKANFVLGSLSQEAIGARFKEIFTGLDEGQKVFLLGQLAGDLNGPLTPESFAIRTMPAPGATSRDADNAGDGAVLLFIKLKGGQAGSYPSSGSDFKYPIPEDAAGKEYTGTLLLSSRVLLDVLIKPHALQSIGYGVKFKPYAGENDVAWRLTATEGEFKTGEVVVSRDLSDNDSVRVEANYDYPFASKTQSLALQVNDRRLQVTWDTAAQASYYHKWIRHILPDKETWGTVDYECALDMPIHHTLEKDGTVSFSAGAKTIDLNYRFDESLKGISQDDDNAGYNYLKDQLKGVILDKLSPWMDQFSFPAINTFLLQNLLFPNHNVLQLSDAHVPGDLALFGHIDPQLTSLVITPRQSIIEAGGSQQLSLVPAMSAATWSVRGTEPGETNVGSVDAKGLYKAPAPGSMPEGYKTVVVTAKGTLNGKAVSASALMSVLESTIAISPVFQVCDTGGTVALTGEALQTVQPAWSLITPAQGGKLSSSQGRACTYTAPPPNPGLASMFIDAIQVKNPTTGAVTESRMLVLNGVSLSLPVIVSESSRPETGEVKLQVVAKSGPIDIPPEAICTLLVSGGGTLSPAGVFKEPAKANGFAIVSVVIPGDFSDLSGFIVLPLPLSTYADLSRRVSRSIEKRAVAALRDDG